MQYIIFSVFFQKNLVFAIDLLFNGNIIIKNEGYMKDVKISQEIHALAKAASKAEHIKGVASFVEKAIMDRAKKKLPQSAIEWQAIASNK